MSNNKEKKEKKAPEDGDYVIKDDLTCTYRSKLPNGKYGRVYTVFTKVCDGHKKHSVLWEKE